MLCFICVAWQTPNIVKGTAVCDLHYLQRIGGVHAYYLTRFVYFYLKGTWQSCHCTSINQIQCSCFPLSFFVLSNLKLSQEKILSLNSTRHDKQLLLGSLPILLSIWIAIIHDLEVNVEVTHTVESVAIGLAQFKCLFSMPQFLDCIGWRWCWKLGEAVFVVPFLKLSAAYGTYLKLPDHQRTVNIFNECVKARWMPDTCFLKPFIRI